LISGIANLETNRQMIESNRDPEIPNQGIDNVLTRLPAINRRRFRDVVALAAIVLLLLTNGFAGSQYVQRLRSLPALSGVYMVAMYGYGQLSNRNLSKDPGFDEHMVKPVHISKLKDFFERLSTGMNTS